MDRDLVAAARRGDQAAFMDLVRPRSERLFGIALQILRDIDRAEDALQDALVIAWRDLRGSAIRTGSMRGSAESSSTCVSARRRASVAER